MQRYAPLASVCFVLPLMVLLSSSSFAATPKQKMETCKFGADHPMLAGKQRADFIKKCMSEKNDPRGPSAGAPAEGKPN